jgi:hypothetical protein
MDGVINPYFVLKGTCQSTKENAVKPNVYSLYTQKQKENMLWGGGGVLPTHPSKTIRLTIHIKMNLLYKFCVIVKMSLLLFSSFIVFFLVVATCYKAIYKQPIQNERPKNEKSFYLRI